jgi:hypothetical protein
MDSGKEIVENPIVVEFSQDCVEQYGNDGFSLVSEVWARQVPGDCSGGLDSV